MDTYKPKNEALDPSLHGSKPTHRNSSTQQLSSPPFGSLLQTLTEADFLAADGVQSNARGQVKITRSKCVASFNWLDCDEPSILIPGAPPAWTPPNKPPKIEEDKGDYFRDPNAARFPASPLEPAVQSVLTENEELETQKVDLFACSSTMSNLLRFVRRGNRPFRFFVEVVGNTVFFTRHENSPTQLIEGVKGYGHTFPEAYTTWDTDVEGTVSHQRLLRYDLAGLDCILRFECDGYLPSKLAGSSNETVHSLQSHTSKEIDEVRPTSDSGNECIDLQDDIQNKSLRIKKAGQKIPQEAVFDLKTRGGWRKDVTVLEDELPRYWITQVPTFILARHNYGVFNDISVQDIRNNIQLWQATNQSKIRHLVWILRQIIKAVKLRKDGKLEVCVKDLDTIELREQDSNDHNVLSPGLKLRWMDNTSS